MPRFQSRLFNWIDRSLPAKLGRSARRLLDRKFEQLSGFRIQELPQLLAYEAAKAALYPVYLIASAAKRTFPALDRRKNEPTEKLRSQPDAAGLLPESGELVQEFANNFEVNFEVNFEQGVDLQKDDLPNPEIPLFLRPLTRFLNWVDRTKIKLDRNIAAIVKRSPDNLTTSPNSELDSGLLANRIFAKIWQQQVEQSQSEQNSLKESDGLAENVAMGKNINLEQLRRLIEAAIAYFFGNQSAEPVDTELSSSEEFSGISELPNPEALPESPKLRQRQVSVSLNRLRELIASAIDYFISKRSLAGEAPTHFSDIQERQPDLLSTGTTEATDKIQKSSVNYSNRDQTPNSDNSNSLKKDDKLERLQKLIEAAIAYFFGKQLSQPSLEPTSDITTSQSSCLRMEEVFGDDHGPWPRPLDYETTAFTKSPDINVINSSGELQSFETTTTQIFDDRLESSLVFEEELLMYQQQNGVKESDRPLKAWIDTKATILGYAYNPLMTVILWVDAIVVKLEDLIIAFWKGLLNFPSRLINFIRYGK